MVLPNVSNGQIPSVPSSLPLNAHTLLWPLLHRYIMDIASKKRLSASERLKELREQCKNYKYTLGQLSCEFGPALASRLFQVTKWVAIYWQKKFIDPAYRHNSHGGARNTPFSEDEVSAMCRLISDIATTKPTTRLALYKKKIEHELNIGVSLSYIKSVFKAAGWTYVASCLLSPPFCGLL